MSPKKSVWIQEKLGADIILAFDEPTSPLHDYKYNKEALARTHRWEKESLKAKTTNQKMYGIVQGGLFEDLRNESAKFIGGLDFDGFALGGSFGSSFSASGGPAMGGGSINQNNSKSWIGLFHIYQKINLGIYWALALSPIYLLAYLKA